MRRRGIGRLTGQRIDGRFRLTVPTARPEPGHAWLDRRHYDDLDERAEHALRAAGLAFEDDRRAEAHLAEAQTIAPDHRAVIVAHYRFHFYKHRFVEAERHARACLMLAAREIGLPADFHRVTPRDHDFGALEEPIRFWLFALQAYGYVLLRLGRKDEGFAALEKIVELDGADQTKTRVLIETLSQAGDDENT